MSKKLKRDQINSIDITVGITLVTNAENPSDYYEKASVGLLSYIQEGDGGNLSDLEIIDLAMRTVLIPHHKEIEKLQAENEQLKKDKSKLEKAINRIRKDVSNGEHIDPEWVELALREEVVHPLIEASVKMHEAIKRENVTIQRKLDLAVEALNFYGDKNNWAAECFDCKEEDMEYLPNDNNSEDLWENVDVVSGKRARQTLKEIGEEK